jgi:EAL domain-containing protein (putative c-di-GMP-specific phosphodiesterase class I)
MSEMFVDDSPTTDRSERTALCFVVDPDFGFLQNFCKQLRSAGVDAVELLNSSRLAENVDDHNPDLVFVDASPINPSDCARALMSLKDCRYGGRVQLIGRCETSLLEGFRKLGTDSMLDMLPALQKPINFSDVRKTIAQQKLNSRPVAAPGLTLKSALSSDFITFWYQPKVDLLKRRVVGAEAFARIAHPQHGIIAPAHFLARADDEDIIELAKRALVSTLKFSAKLDELGIALQLAINIDYDTLAKSPVSELVAKHRPRNEQWPGLVIEMPEAQLLNKVVPVRDRFQELRKYGVSLAIDNFGRGNSSFAALRYLPFAELKIDPSFVQNCAANKGNARICKSMIQFAQNFERSATAVGIETIEDAQSIMGLGCHFGQGYIFGKPMTDQQLVTMVRTGREKSDSFVSA